MPEGAFPCTSTHFVDGMDLGVQEKSPGWGRVARYVRIVEVAGSSPVTSTKESWSSGITNQGLGWRDPQRDSIVPGSERARSSSEC